ncbi:hypothetical protein Ppb6_01087 [Photorhabdus australis subsp. thailandensis]|uniref:Uncharacterized protein n=1 Tax=Photorhabdus australis subsp. thailandensis TaxID=2805096 RepID=A0A1C0U720_9GAMM|nr:hypothetical protein Ppb6_01087 [Photorhabdus australis subsp. thailandensis]
MVSHYVRDNAKSLGNTMTAETIYYGYIPYGFQDESRRQGSESPGA